MSHRYEAQRYEAQRYEAQRYEESPRERWAMHGFTFFGLQLAVTPLLLWVAWSPTILGIGMANAGVAAIGAIICYQFTAVPKPRRPGPGRNHLP